MESVEKRSFYAVNAVERNVFLEYKGRIDAQNSSKLNHSYRCDRTECGYDNFVCKYGPESKLGTIVF